MAYLTIAFSFALAGGLVGRSKGSPFWVWFLISGLVPFLGLAAALLYRRESGEPLRRCPGCGRWRPVHDAICMKCGTELEYPDEEEIVVPPPGARVKARL